MSRLYVLWAVLVVVAVGYANREGWALFDSLSTGSWRHHSGVSRGFHAK